MDAGTSNLFRIILTYLQSRRSGHKQKKNSRTAAMQANIIPVITIACWSSSSHPGRESHLKWFTPVSSETGYVLIRNIDIHNSSKTKNALHK